MRPRLLQQKSIHEGTHAKVRVDFHITEKFELRNELRQGCTLARILFYGAVVAKWTERY